MSDYWDNFMGQIFKPILSNTAQFIKSANVRNAYKVPNLK